jgi:hypothetical protein
MMKNEDIRKLSIKVIGLRRKNINLFDFSDFIKDDDDIDEFKDFIDYYNSKHNVSYIEISNSTGVLKKNENLVTVFYKEINNLTAQKFEKFSAIICNYLGFENEYFATKISNDQGIDFFAYKTHSHFTNQHKEYIFGQCKKFKEKLVSVKEIRELVGSVALFKMQEYSTDKIPYKDYTLDSYTPITVYFIGSYYFSDDAKKLCDNCGILYLDLIDLIYILTKGIINKKLPWLDYRNKYSSNLFKKEIDNIKIIK